MLTTTATLAFLLVTSALAALAVHEYLGSGRKNRGAPDTHRLRAELEAERQADIDHVVALVEDLRVEKDSLASDMTRHVQMSTKEGAQHEAAIAVIFQELRNTSSELRYDLDHMNQTMADIGSKVVDEGRLQASLDEMKSLVERVTTLEGTLQSHDLRLCALDDSVGEIVTTLSPDDTDLKRIKGIGATLEQTLKGLGVKSIDQVANLTVDEIETLSEKLGTFASRIERDGWIDQARTLRAEGLKA